MDLVSDNSLYGMHYYQDRILTFHNWPKQIIPDKFCLAQAGFYYTGQSDVTVCFACNLKLNQWDRQDMPWEEHKRLSPDCRYLKMVGYGEISESEDTTMGQTQKASAFPFYNHFKTFSK
ncbi:MAG: baculoviral IAP repeat-containing protein [Candidatus Thiodiazotropha endolucinida]|nr:baculoviral IAP repeat-containing protein [Candidatus Thiodiazotropha endolucinida]